MARFFTDSSNISGGIITLGAEDKAHIRSLRLRPNERFIVCDGEGTDYICKLAEPYADSSNDEAKSLGGKESRSAAAYAEIVETHPSSGEPSVVCTVFIAFAKGERLEYAIQKSIELGARDIMLFPSERCVSIPGDMNKKAIRLQKIALETAKQCGRGIVPQVQVLDSLKEALDMAVRSDLALFPYECEEEFGLKQAMGKWGEDMKSVSIVTGPEGGFEPHEADLAKEIGMARVTLGKRILRCETAPVAVLSAVMFHTGNLG